MHSEKMSTEPAGLQTLSDRIEAWRSARPRTRPMPEALWSEAASMARQLGVFRVSRALRLNFDTLKRRAGARSAPGRSSRRGRASAPILPTRTDFVEVKGLAEVGVAGLTHEALVEVVSCDGARLSIRLKCASTDVAALIRAFRGER